MILTSLLLLQAILSHKLKSNVSCISLKLERKGITETIIPLSLHCRDTKSQNEFNNSFCDINVPKCINRIHIHAMAYRQCRRGFLGLWFATRGFFAKQLHFWPRVTHCELFQTSTVTFLEDLGGFVFVVRGTLTLECGHINRTDVTLTRFPCDTFGKIIFRLQSSKTIIHCRFGIYM